MFSLDTLDLARLQFASTLLFHIIFLALSIGLSTYLAFLRCMAVIFMCEPQLRAETTKKLRVPPCG